MGWRFATIEDREAVVAMITDAAAGQSLQLTPPELAPTPALWRRADGTSMFRPRHGAYFTSEDLLAAEARLLDRAADRTAPRVPAGVVAQAAAVRHDGNTLTTEQAGVLEAVATSGRQVDVLVGPAGAGKTTAMRALRTAWTARHGTGSVVGLAPSAAAAAVLAEDLGIACDNTAKWLYEHARGRAGFRRRAARHHRRGHPRRHPHLGPPHRPGPGRRGEGAARRGLGTSCSPSTPAARSRSWSTRAATTSPN